jgi:hypothetical protein
MRESEEKLDKLEADAPDDFDHAEGRNTLDEEEFLKSDRLEFSSPDRTSCRCSLRSTSEPWPHFELPLLQSHCGQAVSLGECNWACAR